MIKFVTLKCGNNTTTTRRYAVTFHETCNINMLKTIPLQLETKQ